MTTLQLIITVLICALATIFTRFCAFLLFPDGRKVPAFIVWLRDKLPVASMAMLIIYCLKGVSFAGPGGWIPPIAAVVITAFLHAWKKQIVLSIIGGTAVYMILIRMMPV